MPIKFIDRYTEGYEAIIEAEEGHLLLGGRQVTSGAVFDRFADALSYMNAVIESNVRAKRSVKLGKVVEFRGMLSCGVHIPDKRMPLRS